MSAFLSALKAQTVRVLGSEQLDFNGLLYRLKGAQQQDLKLVLEELLKDKKVRQFEGRYKLTNQPHIPDWARTRARVIDLLRAMPPANPLGGQWWFNFDSAVNLAQEVWTAHWGDQVAFIGSPVAGFSYTVGSYLPCSILEFDRDVISVVKVHLDKARAEGLRPDAEVLQHDAFDESPAHMRNRFAAIVCDPPWYEAYSLAFLARCFEVGIGGALVYWSLAPLFTRPEAETQRNNFLEQLTEFGSSILSIESATLSYVVPEFELEAYRHIPAFYSRVWRRADLLIFRLPSTPPTHTRADLASKPSHLTAQQYYRRAAQTRIFFIPSRMNKELPHSWLEDQDFGHTVSLSAHSPDRIALWTTKRQGFEIGDLPLLPAALARWENGDDLLEIERVLESETSNVPKEQITAAISLLRLIGSGSGEETAIRRHAQLRDNEARILDPRWATVHHHSEDTIRPDPYRLEFQRYRDKILWSKAFRQLASKTQVFFNFGDDRFRSRLTHTLEVAQIARTLSRAFGLNEDLTEAIALAHDIGHPPFGHAGEEAINGFLCRVINNSYPEKKRTVWFSHYEHGIDVLRWLEDLYFSPGAERATGLGISIEVYDGVFKHMYNRRQHSEGRTTTKSQEELYQYSKHQDLLVSDKSSLEAQAVRIADKICYLVQDIEDGILAGIISLQDLHQCRLFSRPYVDLLLSGTETSLHRFLSQRGEIINILMRDTLEATAIRLKGISGIDDPRMWDEYVVKPSDEIIADISEVWKKIQVNVLHKDPKVVRANARAARIIETLMMLFSFCPHLVTFSTTEYFELLDTHTEYMQRYKKAIGSDHVSIPRENGSLFAPALAMDKDIILTSEQYRIPLKNLVRAKDYVASLTDGQALHLYRHYAQATNGFY